MTTSTWLLTYLAVSLVAYALRLIHRRKRS